MIKSWTHRSGRLAVASRALAVAGLLSLPACGSSGGDRDGGSGDTGIGTPSSAVATTSTTQPVGPRSSTPPATRTVLVARFDQPVMVAPVPGATETFFVVERSGRIRLLAGGAPAGVVLDVSARVSTGGERGLLGLALAPDGGHAYVNYTDTEGDTRVVEYAVRPGGVFDAASERELLRVEQPFSNHNGGHLAFGPDGLLYIGLGDGGSGGDPDERAQDLGDLLGKMLRIDPKGSPYAVPDSNPFTGRDGARPEIWAYGLRNPWRFSFDRATGRLWIGDVGQNRFEEIDRAPEGRRGGDNYGWDRYEGFERFEGDTLPDAVEPLLVYQRDGGACAVTGGYVYRGSRIPDLTGWYVFGDYCSGQLSAVAADAASPAEPVDLGLRVESLVSFAEDAAGELFALSLDGGVYRLEPGSS